ncbi:uncharacterized protein I206_104531 [Kwoniella pini CBS 10737]|uniref:Uncharacterized protein n=1 Tax=Kwoniella pini CBS 10737 TaxID=1296096 RepID=A0A1B9I774_9TREE|nr:uncharacterized protein I206_02063 [Kwoniella pini CBS 10737]OCF51349.1 hypothetical protein I206_02063 [Kwoniella pini CBS 10737]
MSQIDQKHIYIISTLVICTVLYNLDLSFTYKIPLYLGATILGACWTITRFCTKWFFYLILPFLFCQYYFLLPWVIRRYVPQARAARLSIVGAFRGFEWHSSKITARAENGAWRWGGRKDESAGYFIYRVEDVSLRMRNGSEKEFESNRPSQKYNSLPSSCRLPLLRFKQKLSAFIRSQKRIDGFLIRNCIWGIQVAIHYIPGFARLISLEFKNCRIILEDFENIELVFDEFSFGAMINFQGVVEGELGNQQCLVSPSPSPQPAYQEVMRQNPLCFSPISERGRPTFSPPTSPPWSPIISPTVSPPMSPNFGSLAVPDPLASAPSTPNRQERSTSRLADARRRASVLSSSTSATAGYVWNRVTGRLYGSVTGTASIVNIRLVQPKSSDQPNIPQTPSHASSFRSIQALLRHNHSTQAPITDNGPYETLVGISGRTKAALGLGFGPKKGLWGEDTLDGQFETGEVKGNVAALQNLLDLMKQKRGAELEKPAIPRGKTPHWSARDWKRTILRAIKSVNVDLQKLSLVHYLNSPSSLDNTEDCYNVSVDLTQLGIKVSAADASNNDRARNAFGTNSAPESKIRGVGFELNWESISLDCLAPNEKTDEKSQLFVIQNGVLDGFSSWRPAGWRREELLFSSDPNLALIVVRSEVGSVNTAVDLQLLHELGAAWQATHPHKEKAQKAVKQVQHQSQPDLPPRIRMAFDVGHISAHLADRLSENTTAIMVDSDGMHFGCFTTFSDLIGRRRDKASSRQACQDEETIRENREKYKDFNIALPPSELPPNTRRSTHRPQAVLYDDYSIALKGDAQINIEPLRIKIKISDDNFTELATIGRLHGTVQGDVYGRQTPADKIGRYETATFDWASLSSSIDLGIDEGIHIDLWKMEVIDTLIAMGKAHQQGSPVKSQPAAQAEKSILDRLPSGISARFSLGMINMFVGHEDINPHLRTQDGPPIRGTWIQTSAVFEYALYQHYAQALPWRHQLTAPMRAKLQLPEDITVQALAFASRYRADGGDAALTSLVVEDFVIQPIYNGEKFDMKGGTRQKLIMKSIPQQQAVNDQCHWGTQRIWARLKAVRDEELRESHDHNGSQENVPLRPLEQYIPKLGYSVPPIEVSGTDQAQRPCLRIRNSRLHLTIQRTRLNAPTESKITSRLDNVEIIGNYSHVYCILHTALALKKLLNGWKRPKNVSDTASTETRKPLNISIGVLVPNFTAHIAFPLKEQLFFYSSNISFTKPPTKGILINADQALMYVPSPTTIGEWEELGRIKKLSFTLSDPGKALEISPSLESIRVRVPHRYQMNGLILDINVTIKALKLLLRNFFKSSCNEFSTRHVSIPEEPKRLPTINLLVGYISLEAKDDPADTNLNLIWRAGFLEQAKRNNLEDAFAKKITLMNSSNSSSEDSLNGFPNSNGTGRAEPKLTKKATVDVEDARYRLDVYLASNWIRRMKAAKREQRRREALTLKPMHGCGPNIKLPINIVPSSQTAPLLRATMENVNLTVSNPGMSREEIIEYMGQVSSPFEPGAKFSLMVPLKINWTMSEAKFTLRDYPLPLLKIPPTDKETSIPSYSMKCDLIIAEEYANEDSTFYVPVEVLPDGCGGENYGGLTLDIAKTIMPVKMYGEPRFKINSTRTTEFTWGMSYQFAIQDFVKVIETFSHPPRDPSPKLGSFDKMRLICHLKPIVEFEGPVHLHLKGTFDPYLISGLGAGFALSWKGNTKFLINQPNEDREALQVVADSLLIAIPDLTALNDSAATGSSIHSDDSASPQTPMANGVDTDEPESSLIDRRYTKPCAKFVGGTKVGFGFGRERTCRPWNCEQGCGDTDDPLHRKCRIFDFLPHQKIILKSPEVVRREEKRLGRTVDSYEGFRSDYTHFSVSVIAPTKASVENDPQNEDPAHVNSLHCTPKAMHHFIRWYNLFHHITWLPTREGPTEGGDPGSLFIGSRKKSKKESKPLATIKYRFDLRPLYVSHIYPQVTRELWAQGKSESLGIKVRAGRILFDAHSRIQERTIWHEELKVLRNTPHKPLYAADVVADDLTIKGIRAHFVERVRLDAQKFEKLPRSTELPKESKVWFDLTDYIDADRKPLDEDPQVEIIDFGDCPHVYFCRRTNSKDLNLNPNSAPKNRKGIESSKFGFEKTHHCYLDEAESRTEVDKRVTEKRIMELQNRLDSYPTTNNAEYENDLMITQNAINLLKRYLINVERDNPDQYDESGRRTSPERLFQDTIEIQSPRLFYNDASRPLLWSYAYSVSDRRKEEYHVSHKSLREYRDNFRRRKQRYLQAMEDHEERSDSNVPEDMVGELARSVTEKPLDSVFKILNVDNDREPIDAAKLGLPDDVMLKPKLQISIFKPQIALRSDASENAIVLLAVQEATIKRFAVEDPESVDSVTTDVLTRSFATLKDVQAFYPTTEALNRERSSDSASRALDFVPLEIFLDARSQATDYDRILLRTDIAGSYDQFNRIRIPRQLKWPKAYNAAGDPIEHLRIHQDLMTIITPQIKLFATSKHYDALYTVITDLLSYSDPDHQHRAQAVKDFSRQFDSADRDANRLIIDIHTLQQTMRHLMELQRGYETNLERLEEAGKDELFKIRADLAEGYESLYTINALIANTLAKDDARAFLKNALRLDVRLREVSWRMLKDDCISSLAQVSIKNTLCSYSNNKNGSTDCALVLGDVSVNSLAPDAKYDGMIVSQDDSSSKKKVKPPFAKVYWSSYPPIGGIPVFPEVDVALASVRFGIEEKVGHQFVDYIFSDRIRRRREKAKKQSTISSNGNATKGSKSDKAETSSIRSTSTRGITQNSSTSTEDLSIPTTGNRNELYPLSRSRSQVSINSHNDPDTLSGFNNNDDARLMRERASVNRYFGRISFHRMNLTLSYTSDDSRKHGTFTMPDCVNFHFKAPDLVYTGKYWVPEEIFEHVKRDTKSAAFNQWSDILPQLWKNTSIFKSKKTLRSLTERTSKAVGVSLPSPLKTITTHTSTTTTNDKEEDNTGKMKSSKSENIISPTNSSTSHTSPLIIKRDTLDSNYSHSSSPSNGNGNRSLRSIKSISPGMKSDESTDEDDNSISGSNGKHKEKGFKGLLGKLNIGNKHHHHNNNSSDELARSKSRGGSIERIVQQSTPSLISRIRSKDNPLS